MDGNIASTKSAVLPASDEEETAALEHTFRQLCGEYEELLDEAAQATQPVDERVGLALFKIDEASAAAELVRADADVAQAQLLDALLDNCHELEDIFIRINIMERFVSKVQETTRELEKRVESTSRAAGPVLNAGSVSSLLRSFSKRVTVSEPAATAPHKWEPVAFDFSTKELMARLEKGDARELGVSISSTTSLLARPAASSSSSSLLAAIADMHAAPMGLSHQAQMGRIFQ
ncbi:hypothetical protein PybrP1_008403 [[Pythium] brassicae (nom. inval.)]|nr:hypothetical protein PybrP1_008403 [[Pythium] brassicae (nom. inval.)]